MERGGGGGVPKRQLSQNGPKKRQGHDAPAPPCNAAAGLVGIELGVACKRVQTMRAALKCAGLWSSDVAAAGGWRFASALFMWAEHS